MNDTFVPSRLEMLTRPSNTGSDSEYTLNVAVVYCDAVTRQWAEKVHDSLARLVGRKALHYSEWRVSDLTNPSTYWAGVAALAQADVIVVSLYEGEPLLSVFYVWVNLWLDVRSGRPGALVALVAPTDGADCGARETRRYLCAAANQGRLQLLECNPQTEPIPVPRTPLTHLAKAA